MNTLAKQVKQYSRTNLCFKAGKLRAGPREKKKPTKALEVERKMLNVARKLRIRITQKKPEPQIQANTSTPWRMPLPGLAAASPRFSTSVMEGLQPAGTCAESRTARVNKNVLLYNCDGFLLTRTEASYHTFDFLLSNMHCLTRSLRYFQEDSGGCCRGFFSW